MTGPRVAGIRLERSGRVYFVSVSDVGLAVGDQVAVEVGGRVGFGRVVIAPGQVLMCEVGEPQGKVIRS